MTETLAAQKTAILTDPPESPETNVPDQGQPANQETLNLDPDKDAPYGYKIINGQRVPKKSAGRPRKDRTIHIPRDNTGERQPINRPDDKPPDGKSHGAATDPPPYSKGVIAKGMAKLYRRAGKIVQVMDRSVGTAIIESADDCGEAWDDLAKTNPRVRAFLMRLMKGGAWTSLIMAHAPIFMAVIMKDGIRKHIPFMKLLSAVLEEDENATDVGGPLGGIKPEDMQEMMKLANGLLGGMAARVEKDEAA